MTNGKPKITDSEVCTIRIMFPVNSDEQAIECKKKIRAVLHEIPDVNMQFNIMDTSGVMPPTPR